MHISTSLWDKAAGALLVQKTSRQVSDFQAANQYVNGTEIAESGTDMHKITVDVFQIGFA